MGATELGAMMLNNNSINRSFFTAVGDSKGGGVKFDKHDLSPALQTRSIRALNFGSSSMPITLAKVQSEWNRCGGIRRKAVIVRYL